MNEIKVIKEELKVVKKIFSDIVPFIPKLEIGSEMALPYGLQEHTRSISWIAQQVIVQQGKYNKEKIGLQKLKYDFPDTSLFDCKVKKNDVKYHVNLKVTSSDQDNRNDIAAVAKLITEYNKKPNFRIIYAVIPVEFDNREIKFNSNNVHTFSPQFLPIYVNPRNLIFQAKYYSKPVERSRENFLKLLREEFKVRKKKRE